MTTRKTKPLILMMALTFALVTVISGTFAWFTSHDSVTNHMETGSLTNGDAKIVEIFDEDEPLDPGTSVDKFVGAVNTGSTEAFIRISFAEAFQKLTSGDAASSSTIFDGASSKIPQLFNEASIATGGAYATWTTLAAGDTNFTAASVTTALATAGDAVIRYNKTTANGNTFYRFVAYAPMSGLSGDNVKYNGRYQLVNMNFNVNNSNEITVSAPAFMQFTQDAVVTAKWAALSSSHAPVDSYTLKLNTPAVTLPDATSHADAMLSLLFDSSVKTNIAACNDGDWWYSTDDGYFYYIGKLASGAQTKNWLLNGVALDEAAGNEYTNTTYDLTPCMEAIQSVEEALTSTAGWNLDATDYAALIAKLTA